MDIRASALSGQVIPGLPLALNSARRLDERVDNEPWSDITWLPAGRRVGRRVHTTQFAIRDPKYALFQPVLELASEELRTRAPGSLRIGGICGATEQALIEAGFLREHGFHCVC